MRHRICKLVKNGLYKEAITLYTKHHAFSVSPSNFTFPYILKACAELKAVTYGEMLHAQILKAGYKSSHTFTDLTNMYMKIGLVDSAAKLFDEIPKRNLSILNVVISGFAQNGFFDEGFAIFKLFCVPDVRIDSVTVAGVTSTCRNLVNGVQIHCLAVKIGVERDQFAATSLMTMYLSCAEMNSAVRLFSLIENKEVICYAAYLSGLGQNGVVEMVIQVFQGMLGLLHERPSGVTVVAALSACGNGKLIQFGRQLHGLIIKLELESDTKVGTSLVDMYSKCGYCQCSYAAFREIGRSRNLITWNSMIAGFLLNGEYENAINVFDELECEGREPDVVTWNSLISGFSSLGKAEEALLFFRKMLACDVNPNEKCVTSLLAVCSSFSLQKYGKQLHAYAARTGVIDDQILATAIIDMYMKCGQPSLACNVFNEFHIKPNDPAFWNAMISGYSKNGLSEAAFGIFDEMIEQKVIPNSVTLSCLLSICSYTGQLEKAFEIFRLLTVKYGLDPSPKHINILIELLSREGRLDEAFELLKAEDETTSSTGFASLLDAAKSHLDPKLGAEICQRVLESQPQNPIPFVILSNIYAGLEKWKDVHKIRQLMDEKGLEKLPGVSSVIVA